MRYYVPPTPPTPSRKVLRRGRAAIKGGYGIGSKGQKIGNPYAPRHGVYNSGDKRQRA